MEIIPCSLPSLYILAKCKVSHNIHKLLHRLQAKFVLPASSRYIWNDQTLWESLQFYQEQKLALCVQCSQVMALGTITLIFPCQLDVSLFLCLIHPIFWSRSGTLTVNSFYFAADLCHSSVLSLGAVVEINVVQCKRSDRVVC